MKPLILFHVLFLPIMMFGQSVADSHIKANVPDAKEFRTLFLRDTGEFLSRKTGKPITTDYVLLRDGPTQTGVAFPKFYAWVIALDEQKRPVVEGAMRLAAIEKKQFQVTDFIIKEEIAVSPGKIEEIFPRALLPAIREKAGIK